MEKNFLDKIEKIKRGPAITLKKDIGIILTNTAAKKYARTIVELRTLGASEKQIANWVLQQKAIEALSILTGKAWQYNEKTRRLEVVGELPEQLKLPPEVQEPAKPSEPGYITEKLDELSRKQVEQDIEQSRMLEALALKHGAVQIQSE